MATRKKAAAKSTESGVAAVAQERLLGTVHQVWLAGLGAVSKAQSGAPRLLEDLVSEGARVHARAMKVADEAVRSLLGNAQATLRGRVDEARERAADAFENLEEMFQTRVHRALKQLGVPSAEEIAGLSMRVDALNANIEKLTRERMGTRRPRSEGKRARSGNGRRRRGGEARRAASSASANA